MRNISHISSNTKLIIVILLCMVFHNNLYANNKSDSVWVYSLEDSIKVVASRYNISLKNISNSYEVISAKAIETFSNHSALEVVDISYPSAFVMDKKVMGFGVGTGGAGQVSLRGQGGHPNTGVLVLLNGHPDFMGIFGHPLPDVYGMDNIKQLEVLAGPNSTVFGSQAMGGVINIISEPDYKKVLKISGEGGSFKSFKLGLNFTKKINKHNFFLTFNKKRSNGHIKNTSFSSMHFLAGWNLKFNESWQLSVQGRYVPYEFDDPIRKNKVDFVELGTYAKIERLTGEVILKNTFKQINGSTQIYANKGNHKFYDGFRSRDFTIGISSYQNYRYSKKINIATGFDAIKFGGKAQNDFTKLPNGNPIVNSKSREMQNFGIYLLGFYSPFELVNFKGGVRYQNNSLSISQISPIVGITFKLHNSLNLFTSYQTGFRTPTLMELYLFPSANSSLKEETIKTVEVGTTFLWNVANSIRISIYKNFVNNMIQSLPHIPFPPAYKFQNSGELNQWGFETQLKLRINNNIRGQLAYGFIDPNELTAFNPKHQFKYMVQYTYERFSFNIYGKYIGKLYASNDFKDRLPNYHLMNIHISKNYEVIEIYAKLLNVFNKKYYALPDYQCPGIQGRIGIAIKM